LHAYYLFKLAANEREAKIEERLCTQLGRVVRRGDYIYIYICIYVHADVHKVGTYRLALVQTGGK